MKRILLACCLLWPSFCLAQGPIVHGALSIPNTWTATQSFNSLGLPNLTKGDCVQTNISTGLAESSAAPCSTLSTSSPNTWTAQQLFDSIGLPSVLDQCLQTGAGPDGLIGGAGIPCLLPSSPNSWSATQTFSGIALSGAALGSCLQTDPSTGLFETSGLPCGATNSWLNVQSQYGAKGDAQVGVANVNISTPNQVTLTSCYVRSPCQFNSGDVGKELVMSTYKWTAPGMTEISPCSTTGAGTPMLPLCANAAFLGNATTDNSVYILMSFNGGVEGDQSVEGVVRFDAGIVDGGIKIPAPACPSGATSWRLYAVQDPQITSNTPPGYTSGQEVLQTHLGSSGDITCGTAVELDTIDTGTAAPPTPTMLASTISSISGATATISSNFPNAVNGLQVTWGTPDDTAFTNANNACDPIWGCVVYVPRSLNGGCYLITGGISTSNYYVNYIGDGVASGVLQNTAIFNTQLPYTPSGNSEICTPMPIRILSVVSPLAPKQLWRGPSIKGIAFTDTSGVGAALGAVWFEDINNFTIQDNAFNFFTQRATSIGGGQILSSTGGAGGTGYAVNDTGVLNTVGLSPNNQASYPSTYIITSVGGSGNVTGYTLTGPGKYYLGNLTVPTTIGGAQPGGGSGFTVNVENVTSPGGFGWWCYADSPRSECQFGLIQNNSTFYDTTAYGVSNGKISEVKWFNNKAIGSSSGGGAMIEVNCNNGVNSGGNETFWRDSIGYTPFGYLLCDQNADLIGARDENTIAAFYGIMGHPGTGTGEWLEGTGTYGLTCSIGILSGGLVETGLIVTMSLAGTVPTCFTDGATGTQQSPKNVTINNSPVPQYSLVGGFPIIAVGPCASCGISGGALTSNQLTFGPMTASGLPTTGFGTATVVNTCSENLINGTTVNFDYGIVVNSECDGTVITSMNLGIGQNRNDFLDDGTDSEECITNQGCHLTMALPTRSALDVSPGIGAFPLASDLADFWADTSRSTLLLGIDPRTNLTTMLSPTAPLYQNNSLQNTTAPGTFLTTVTCHDSGFKATPCSAGTTYGALGIASNNAGAGGLVPYVDIAQLGTTLVVFDAGVTLGHYAAASASVVGAATDAGATPSTYRLGIIEATAALDSAPSSITGAFSSGGALPADTYYIGGTCVNIVGGESPPATLSLTTLVSSQNLTINPPVGCGSGTIGWIPYADHASSGVGSIVIQDMTGMNCHSINLASGGVACLMTSNWGSGSIANPPGTNPPVTSTEGPTVPVWLNLVE